MSDNQGFQGQGENGKNITSNFQPTVLYMLKSYHQRGGGAVAIAGEPAQSRSKIAGITSNSGSICGWDSGCWVAPRWTNDEIAQSII